LEFAVATVGGDGLLRHYHYTSSELQGIKAGMYLKVLNALVEWSIVERLWAVRILQVGNIKSALGSRRSVLAEETGDPFPSNDKDS
jgi:hypothetical protein